MRRDGFGGVGALASAFGWADVAVVPLIAILSLPPLVWFEQHPWVIVHTDAPRYLFAASELVLDRNLDSLDGVSQFSGGHGPGFPAVISVLILAFGRDTVALAWAVRLSALANPLLAYFLTKQISRPAAGLIAAALITLFAFNVELNQVFNIDAALLTFYLSSVLALLAAIKRRSPALALLSGVLLGISILTKESAVVNTPLALLAVLLLGWELRGALWHYLGVVLVCVPWWVWAYSVSGRVYLIDRLPVGLQTPTLVAIVILAILGTVAYVSGMVARFLAAERQRRWAGWFVVLFWTVSLTDLSLATGAHALSRTSLESVRLYLAHLLAPAVFVVPALLLVVAYAIWKVLRRKEPWTLLALAMLFQMPVCLLVVVEGWSPRQFLVPQALFFCALAALEGDFLNVAFGEATSSESAYPARLVGIVVVASLVTLVAMPCAQKIQALLPEGPVRGWFSRRHTVAPQATRMIDWTDKNVPEGERILTNKAQGAYLAYLDGGRHEWAFLQPDQGICVPRPNTQISCNPANNSISRIPPDALWVQMIGKCKVVSLSMPNLMTQLRQSRSDYLMISGSFVYPGILAVPSVLKDSGAFEVSHAEDMMGAEGSVLVRSTGHAPRDTPTLMNRNTVLNLGRCERAKGPGHANWLKAKFPNGIFEVSVSG